jgi:predicted nucleotidyltransferase
MSRDAIIEIIRANRSRLDELHVKSLAIFGSVARGDDHPDSDLDVLVEFDTEPTFSGYFDLKEYLEALVLRPVDLAIRGDLKPLVRMTVEKEAVSVS